MTSNRRLIAGALGLAIGLAACGGAVSSPGGGVAGESATPDTAPSVTTESPSPAASVDAGTSPGAASGSPDASGATGGSPDASGAASGSPATSPGTGTSASPDASADAGTIDPSAPGADLAGMLPDEAGGITFTKRVLSGTEVNQSAFNLDVSRLTPALESAGKTIEDVTVAVATPADATSATAMVIALRIEGVEADQVARATSVNVDALEQTTIAGKTVWAAGSESFQTVVYATQDIAFQIMFADRPTVEAILAALP